MKTYAFTLREGYAGTVEQRIDGKTVNVPKFSGGVLAVGDGDIDVREALDAGKGTITVPETEVDLVGVLTAYPPLKRTVVADDEKQSGDPVTAPVSVPELKSSLEAANVTVKSDAAKADLELAVQQLPAAQAAIAEANVSATITATKGGLSVVDVDGNTIALKGGVS